MVCLASFFLLCQELLCKSFESLWFIVMQKEQSPELKMSSKELNGYMSFVIERLKEKVWQVTVIWFCITVLVIVNVYWPAGTVLN